MRTEELISALAADTLPRQPVGWRMRRAMLVATAISLTAFALFWGPRPDIGAALGSLTMLKTLVPLLLLVLSMAFALALAHPGQRVTGHGAALGAMLALPLGAFTIALAREGQAGLVESLSTRSLVICLLSIPALALPLLVAMLRALSSGASLHPALSGATAGLVAGSGAAAIYSLYCDKDMMLFVLPAYGIAIAGVVLLGAWLGPRHLRW